MTLTFDSIILGISTVSVLLMLAGVLRLTLVSEWKQSDRQFLPLKQDWDNILIHSVLVASLTGFVFTLSINPPAVGLLVGIWTLFLAIAAQTDYRLHLIPHEVTSLMILIGAVGAGFYLTTGAPDVVLYQGNSLWLVLSPLIHLALWVGFWVFLLIVWVAVPTYIMGWADLKMYLAVGLMYAWIVGFQGVFLIIIVQSVFILISGALKRRKEGKKGNTYSPAATSLLPASLIVLTGAVFI